MPGLCSMTAKQSELIGDAEANFADGKTHLMIESRQHIDRVFAAVIRIAMFTTQDPIGIDCVFGAS